MLTLEEIIAELADTSAIDAYTAGVRAILASIEEENSRSVGGSLPGKARNKRRDHQAAWEAILLAYWGTPTIPPIYTPEDFRARFRVRRDVFLHLHDAVCIADPTFIKSRDAAGKWGVPSELKVLAALQYMGLGIASVHFDQGFGMSETLIHKTTRRFWDAIIKAFKGTYLRMPNLTEARAISDRNASRGLPGCLGSIDCMHWYWGNCPNGLKGMYKGRDKFPSVVLEAVADMDYRIWHASFGTPGSVNDITITSRSPLVTAFADASFPPEGFSYMLGGTRHTRPYYLADGIYPLWPIFVKTVSNPISVKARRFAKAQESFRKEVECTFGILRKRFQIMQRHSKLSSVFNMNRCMLACIIIHNIIVDRVWLLGGNILQHLVEELSSTVTEVREDFRSARLEETELLEEYGLTGEYDSIQRQGSTPTSGTTEATTSTASSMHVSSVTLPPLTATEYLDQARDVENLQPPIHSPSRAETYLNELYDDDSGIFSQAAHRRLQRLVLDSVFEKYGNDTSSEISTGEETQTPPSSQENLNTS
jgi:hypothetical protein